ncbi:MAG: hypothetical protein KJ967_05190 [Elusimicrobia bacterium]|nr:hypothetical protein [Elusimicrobiota bacterium]
MNQILYLYTIYKRNRWIIPLILLVMSVQITNSQTTTRTIQGSTPLGSFGGIMNPDLSFIVDIRGLFREKDDNAKNKLLLSAVEFALGGYLHPGIRGDVILALDQDYSTGGPATEIELEEAFISFLDMPLGLQIIAGRKLVDFGNINRFHLHHYPFSDSPLVLEHFFGHHSWGDDGVNLSFLVPNPFDIYFKTSFSMLNGKPLCPHALVLWDGNRRVYNSRVSVDLPWIKSIAGYSRAWDEGDGNTIENIEFTYKYQWPGFVYRRLKLQNEYIWTKTTNQKITSGFYSLVVFSFNQYYEIGSRYDGLFSDENKIEDWAGSFFATRYLSHSVYMRGHYKFVGNEQSGEKENMFFLQISWGLGPHAHRLED